MDREIRMRLRWVELYFELKNAGIVCKRCGISRPTLRKWVIRFKQYGIKGLQSQSKRPKSSPAQKVFKQQEQWILKLRNTKKIGVRRIKNELQRNFNFNLSLATIHKVLTNNQVKPIKRFRRHKVYKRYSRPIPGDRIQMDTCKISPNLYQYTAIDDCTRYKVLAHYPRRTAANTLEFIDKVIEEMPFPIQRIQTDRGKEFFAYKVQERLMKFGIKFRPIKPGSPHLNGKVERTQKTDFEEFYNTVRLDALGLSKKLQEWQHYYNWERGHGALNGNPPMDRYFELIDKVPLWEDVEKIYNPKKERLHVQNYMVDLKLGKLKQCM